MWNCVSCVNRVGYVVLFTSLHLLSLSPVYPIIINFESCGCESCRMMLGVFACTVQ